MPVRTFGDGQVRVRYPSTLVLSEGVRARNRSLLPDGVDASLIQDVLGDSGFEVVQPLTVRRDRSRALPAPGQKAVAQKVDLEVRLRDNEQAVVLMDRGGYLSWHLPQPRARALRDQTSAAFKLDAQRPAGAPATRGLFDDIRTFVLKFSAPVVAGTAMKVLEAGVDEGIVHITSTDPQSWPRVQSLPELPLPVGGSPRILLFVHGTFSSTAGGFASLATDAGKEFLDRAIADYDAVIGYDHRTLSVDPLANAQDLFDKLSVREADGAVVDVICHSRGGLVVRSLVEKILPPAKWTGSINNIVFVGVPNAGTHLAEPDRWSRLVDIYTNLLLESTPIGNAFLAKAIAQCAIGNVGALVKYLAAYAADRGGVPGLAAMRPPPKGQFIVDLNGAQPGQPGAGQPWLVIESDFHAAAGQSKLRIVETIADDVLDKANDLVVDSESMAAIDTPPGGLVKRTLDLGTNSVVYHTNYFGQDGVVRAIQSWLFPTAAAPMPPPMAPFNPDGGFAEDIAFDRAIVAEGGGGGFPLPPPLAPPAARTQAHILAEMPGNMVVREPATARVVLSRNKIKVSAGSVAGDRTISVDENEALTVQVVPKRNITVKGKDTKKFRLPLDDGLSELTFAVQPSSEGPVEVRVVVTRSPAEIVASVTLEGQARQPDDAAHREEVVRKQVEAATATSIDLKDAVRLQISELEKPGYVQYQYVLTLPGEGQGQRYLSGRLHDRAAFVADLFRTIEENWTEFGDKPKEFMKTLQEQGSDLFEQLFPEALREKLWSMRNDMTSILLLADEPYFPWELVHLQPPGRPIQRQPRFLGQYGLVRWQILPFPEKPALRRRRGRVYSICPDYVDPALDLPEIAQEAKFLKRKLGARAVPATPSGVREILRNREMDILHFTGHGFARPLDVGDAKILLRGRNTGKRYAQEYISAKTVKARAQLKAEDGSGPLVVLNACQVGISGAELSSLGGFARAFLERGAQAFVSCLWSVQQEPSRIFVESLYDRLIAGDSIGAAAAAARAKAHTPDDPSTWLGFVIYARPDAKFVKT
jgi:hypothetical protein